MIYQLKIAVDFQFKVIFTHHLFKQDNHSLLQVLPEQPVEALVFIDQGLIDQQPQLPGQISQWFAQAGERVILQSPLQVVAGGEIIKNSLDILGLVGQAVAEAGLCRHSYIIIIGGGAVLDAVGFAASTIHRGIKHIRIPTTTLSQNDSGIGVKNGINGYGHKNYFGCFQPPAGVVVDHSFLSTLDDRHWRAGVAEAFKVAIIKDRDFLDYLVRHAGQLKARDQQVMEYVIRTCALLHLEHIASGGDPFELGSRRPLDFGHWSSHWLESITNYELSHGDAVAIGLAVDLVVAARRSFIGYPEMLKLLAAIEATGLPVWHEQLRGRDPAGRLRVMQGLRQFRQHLGGRLTLAMPDGLGGQQDIHQLSETEIASAIDFLKTRNRRT